jgi:hypothetical protein
MPPPPHPYEVMRQAYIRLGLAPIAAQEFLTMIQTVLNFLCHLSSEDINHLVKQIY